MTRRIVVLAKAATDIEHGIDFYNEIEPGVGAYFRDSIISDIRRLGFFFGQHSIHFGFHRALAARFPFAIYYRDQKDFRANHCGPGHAAGSGVYPPPAWLTVRAALVARTIYLTSARPSDPGRNRG